MRQGGSNEYDTENAYGKFEQPNFFAIAPSQVAYVMSVEDITISAGTTKMMFTLIYIEVVAKPKKLTTKTIGLSTLRKSPKGPGKLPRLSSEDVFDTRG